MRRCIYHTDLGQNAVFHRFSRQIAPSQYSGRSIVGFYRDRSKNFQFLSTAKFITKYCSERFLSICGEKIYLKDF